MLYRILIFTASWVSLLNCCYSVDYKIEVKNVGDVCVIQSEDKGDWAVVAPDPSTPLWVDPSGKYCVVPTNATRNGRITVEAIFWDARRRDRWMIQVAGKPPAPVPDPVVPVPPGPVVVPNKYGLGEVSYREMLKIAGNVGQPTMVSSLDTCAAELAGVTSVQQRDEVYARHRARMDAGLGQEWMPLRRSVQTSMFASFANGKIKTFTDESNGVKEVADAIRLVK